jgi:serine/threonine-protein kinase
VSHHLGSELRHSKYRLLGLVGQGQFGRVFCAVHRPTGKLVALKSLERERFPTHKFLRELRILLSLQHPNIVTCQALEQTATGRYLVMDYCEGGTLRSLMLDDVRLSLPQSLKLVADILLGLAHAHDRGIVHCDIKPENILLNVTPTGWNARISDFGIARISQEFNHQDFGNTGSPAYMAPERFYGQYSVTSDLYSVGILLFELLVGHRPFSGTPTELMSAHLNCPVQIPDHVSPVWHPLLTKALQKLSARRFQSAGEMLSALRIAALQPSGFQLDQQVRQPLLQPTFTLPTSQLRSQVQEPIASPILELAPIQVQSSSKTDVEILL